MDLTALGGLKSVAQEVVLSIAPQSVQNAIGKVGETITVGADAVLRAESFGTINTQNQNKTPANPTFNQTTGIGLATSVLAIGGVAKAVKGKGAPKVDAPDAPDVVPDNNRASNPANGPALNAQLAAQEVASGHAFDKHVLAVGNASGVNEFAGLGIRTRSQFQSFVENVINTATDVRVDSLGKKYFIDYNSRTVVIIVKKGESTAFRPDFGIGFDNYLKRIPKAK